MKTQCIQILAAFCFATMAAWASPISDQQAATMVKGWLRMTPTPLRTPLSRNTSDAVEAVRDKQGAALFYVVALKPQGFVVASADSDIEPVIAFSAGGSFQTRENDPLFALLERDLAAREKAIHKSNQANSANPSAASSKWTRLMQRTISPQTEDANENKTLENNGIQALDDLRVAPFIESHWNQGSIYDGTNNVACYNYYTPPYSSGASSNYVCGCVNTAWAQIMRYFQYPTQPVGTNSFAIDVDWQPTSRQLMGGDGLGGPYNWNRMPLAPGAGTTERERQAIGALTADIGAVCGTSYTTGSSGADVSQDRVRSIFHYNNVIAGTYAQFDNAVNANLDARLPVFMWFYTATKVGHMVVCDGYGYNMSTPYYHLNLGWGGYEDAWYNLPTVNAGGYDFTTLDGYCYNIYPNGTGEVISGRVLTSKNVPLANATITATRKGGGTYTATTDANGIYALARVPSASQYTLLVSETNFIQVSAVFSTVMSVSWQSGRCGNVWGANFTMVPTVPFDFKTNKGALTITRYCGSMGAVTIPDTINGLPVTSIGDDAFLACGGLTSVTIPNSVTQIGDWSFSGCSSLTSVTMGNSVSTIGERAFWNCTSLTNVTISSSLTSIGEGVFGVCTSLTNVTIPNSVTNIGDSAFLNCINLISVTIPNSVASIGTDAFEYCSSLRNVIFPTNVSRIGDEAFDYCTNLTGVYVKGNAPIIGWHVFFSGESAVVYYLLGTSGWGSTFGGLPTALWNPQVQNLGVRANQLGFTIAGSTNLVIVVEATTNLTNPIWFQLGTNTLTGASSYFSDPQWTNYPAQFYRIRVE